MDPVGDETEEWARGGVGAQEADDPGLAGLEGGHGIEEMRAHAHLPHGNKGKCGEEGAKGKCEVDMPRGRHGK